MRVIDRVRVPARIITAEDDPFVPTAPFRDPLVVSNPHLDVSITRHGGHCAFITDSGNDSRWLLGRTGDHRLRNETRRVYSNAINRFAKSGPSPCSSCLK